MGQQAIGYLVKRLDHAFKKAMVQALEPHDLSPGPYAALHHLYFVGPMSSSALARASWVTPQTMHRIVATLKRRGLVRVQLAPGRAAPLALTPAGRASFEAALGDISALEAEMVRGITPSDLAAMRRLLERCRENIEPP